jgi:hypothetical protein
VNGIHEVGGSIPPGSTKLINSLGSYRSGAIAASKHIVSTERLIRVCGLMKTEALKKKEAKERAAQELHRTKKKLGLGDPGPLKGAIPSPLAASSRERRAKPAPTSDRIPGSAPAADLLHAHKWKRGVKETEATAKEMRRKAARIAPAPIARAHFSTCRMGITINGQRENRRPESRAPKSGSVGRSLAWIAGHWLADGSRRSNLKGHTTGSPRAL